MADPVKTNGDVDMSLRTPLPNILGHRPLKPGPTFIETIGSRLFNFLFPDPKADAPVRSHPEGALSMHGREYLGDVSLYEHKGADGKDVVEVSLYSRADNSLTHLTVAVATDGKGTVTQYHGKPGERDATGTPFTDPKLAADLQAALAKPAVTRTERDNLAFEAAERAYEAKTPGYTPPAAAGTVVSKSGRGGPGSA